MYISLNWLREFVEFDFTIEKLDNVLTMLGIEVESFVDYSKKYENFFVGQVVKHEKHPKADKLSLCEVSLGEEVFNVVCGAPNVGLGQKIVFGKLGAVVPEFGFKLEKRKIRDYESHGMICSQFELQLGEDQSGIWVLPEDAPVGAALVDYLKLRDIVLELGLTPNKADCLSHLGIARELAAYLRTKPICPQIQLKESDESADSAIKVVIDDKENCPRYTARVIKNVKITESPDWLKNKLTKIGLRPLNAAVDITNLVLMELGQPLHAFDYDKIAGKKIIVRTAIESEKFTTLDDKERVLDSKMLMICDAEKPVAIAGVMGGQNSEINDSTTNILLESAYFKPSSVRRTAKKLGLMSDSSYRFERGVDIDNVTFALDRAAQLIAELCGGYILEGKVDVYPEPITNIKVEMRFERAKKIIGIDISSDEMINMLSALGFSIISSDNEKVLVEVPHRRNDVSSEIDLIEEIARLFNYDNITPDYTSSIDFSGEGVHKSLAAPKLRNSIVEYFSAKGFNEIYTQNQIDPETAKLFTDNPVVIANPLGEELSIMRPSVLPSMIKTIGFNIRKGNHNLSLFEIGKSFHHTDKENSFVAGYEEREHLVVGIAGNSAPRQWGSPDRKVDFYDIKGILAELVDYFKWSKLKFNFNESSDSIFSKNTLNINLDGNQIGKAGEVDKNILKRYDIETPIYLIWIDLAYIYNFEFAKSKYSPVAPYPSMQRDLAFLFDKGIVSEDVKKEISRNGGNLLKNVEVFDVYKGKNLGDSKISIGFTLNFSASDRTLTDAELDPIIDKIVKSVESKFNCTLRTI